MNLNKGLLIGSNWNVLKSSELSSWSLSSRNNGTDTNDPNILIFSDINFDGKGPMRRPLSSINNSSDAYIAVPIVKNMNVRIHDLKNDLPDLDPITSISPIKHRGPINCSNWVVPGQLLVGGYPAFVEDNPNRENLLKLMQNGIGTFVCLQAEYDPSLICEKRWDDTDNLRPYFKDVEQLYLDNSYWIDKPRPTQIEFIHLPIKYLCSSTTDLALFALCVHIILRLEKGDKIYVHCRFGHGRSGLFVSILLGMIYGLDPDQAMKYCQVTHDQRKIHSSSLSPHTDEQREQVRRILNSTTVKRYRELRYMKKKVYDPMTKRDGTLSNLFFKQFSSRSNTFKKSIYKTPKTMRPIYANNISSVVNNVNVKQVEPMTHDSINTYYFSPTRNQPLTRIIHSNNSNQRRPDKKPERSSENYPHAYSTFFKQCKDSTSSTSHCQKNKQINCSESLYVGATSTRLRNSPNLIVIDRKITNNSSSNNSLSSYNHNQCLSCNELNSQNYLKTKSPNTWIYHENRYLSYNKNPIKPTHNNSSQNYEKIRSPSIKSSIPRKQILKSGRRTNSISLQKK